MAKSIQDLRRERGFRSSKEFADALGVSPSSMSRYDRDTTLIPVRVAWAMADLLGCSIDEVLGREYVTSGKSELQEEFDSLSPETQTLVLEFMAFAKAKDKTVRKKAQMQRDHKFDRLCQLYERMFYQSVFDQAEFDDPEIFLSPDRERKAFREFIVRKAKETWKKRVAQEQKEREEKDGEVINAIMHAYDRRHGCGDYRYDSLGIAVEYMGDWPS